MTWVWEGKIPAGALSVLAGDPGVGKSLLTVQLAAQLTRGELTGKPERVLMLTSEDAIAYVVRPRLEAAGADLELVSFPQIYRAGLELPFQLPQDVPVLQEAIVSETARLVVVDPLMAHLASSIDSWKDQSVRGALPPLHKAAEETGAAVLVVAHLNKGASTNPLQRLGGSVGIPAAARSVLLLGRDPEDPEGELGERRVLAHVKSNVSELSPSLRAQIETRQVAGAGEVPLITLAGQSPLTGSQLLGERAEPRRRKLDLAVDFLEDALLEGPRPQAELVALAGEMGISERTLARARDVVGVKSRKSGAGYHDGWLWFIPEQPESEGALE